MAWLPINDAPQSTTFQSGGTTQFPSYIDNSIAYSWSDRGLAEWYLFNTGSETIKVRATILQYMQGGADSYFALLDLGQNQPEYIPNSSGDPYNEFIPNIVEMDIPPDWGMMFAHANQSPWEQGTDILLEIWQEEAAELVANDDHAQTDAGQAVQINVLANDTYGDEPVQPEDLAGPPTIVESPSNGTAVVNPDGTVTYTPAPGFSGTDTFAYEIMPAVDPPGECVEVQFQGSAFEFRHGEDVYNMPDWFIPGEPIYMVFEGYAEVTYVPDGLAWYTAEGSGYENVPTDSGTGTFSQEGNTACLNWNVAAGT